MDVLTIDIGGTFIKYAVMSDDLKISSRVKIPTPQDTRADLIDALTKIFNDSSKVDGIAISMPGIIDTKKGYCFMGGALHYNDDFYFRDALNEKCPVKITIENDAKCAAIAEATVGSLADVEDGFVMIFGTGIGGGYIKDKKLHRGVHFSAGEISCLITDRDSMPVDENIFAAHCGVPALCKLYAAAKNLPKDEVDGVIVFNAINDGDEIAKDCLNRFAKEIAVQIFNLQTILDPQRFAIGGGISAQAAFLDAIKDNLKKIYEVCPFYTPQAEVVTCKFLNDANLIGALQCYLTEYYSA